MSAKKIAVAAVMVIALMGGAMVMNTPEGTDLDNAKEWDERTKTVTIRDKAAVDLMTVRLISSEPDLCTFEELFEVTNFKAFTPHKDKDFKARTVKHNGKVDVQAVEWFIEQNVSYTVNITDYKVVQVEKEVYNNKTRKNETILVNETIITGYHDETRYKDVWQDYKPYGEPVSKDSVQRIKVVYHKPPEVGDVRIQTIPMFRGVECDELTWWNTSWDHKREIHIDNTGGSALSYYQVNIDLSGTPINSTSLRVVNETADATVPHWQETTSSANCTDLWFNATSIPASSWLNGTYYIYYSNAAAAISSSGSDTFLQYHETATSNYQDSEIVGPNNIAYETRVKATGTLASAYILNGIGANVPAGDEGGDQLRVVPHNPSGDTYYGSFNNGVQTYFNNAPAIGDGAYHIYNITFDGSTATYYRDGVSKGTITTNLPNEAMGLRFSIKAGAAEQEWAFVRKYATTEPTATLGAEEDPLTIASYAPATPLNKNEGDSQTFNITTSESCQCRWYIAGTLVQTNATPSTTHAYTNTSLAVGANQNFSAVVNTSTSNDMQTWDVTVTTTGTFQQSAYKDSWQYVTNLNSTDRTFTQFVTQMSAYYLVHYNKTAQRTYGYKSGRWTKYESYNIPSGDVAMLRYTANDTITRDNATGTFSGTLKTGLNHIGHSYNGTRNLTWYNTTIASNNVTTITFSYPINGTTKIYTYGSSANGTVPVSQGFGVEINVTADTAFAGI